MRVYCEVCSSFTLCACQSSRIFCSSGVLIRFLWISLPSR